MNRDRPERRSPDSRNRKTLQLCRQAEHALRYALFELDDPLLESLVLDEVTSPAGDSQLCVVLRPGHAEVRTDLDVLYRRLAAARGTLRAAVAKAICRRRTPQLTFAIRHAACPGEEEGADDE